MTDWTRVKDMDTGHEYSTAVVLDSHQVLDDKDATDRFGNPLPPKPSRPLATLTNDAGKPVSAMTVPELQAYAGGHHIDLGGASLKDDVLAAIVAHEQGDNTPAA